MRKLIYTGTYTNGAYVRTFYDDVKDEVNLIIKRDGNDTQKIDLVVSPLVATDIVVAISKALVEHHERVTEEQAEERPEGYEFE